MPLKREHRCFFFLLTTRVILGVTPVSSDTTALTKSYFKLTLKIVRGFLQKCLFFKSQIVTATGCYGIETFYQM